jgi:hypothetical protein
MNKINLQDVMSVPKSVMARRVGDEVIVLDLAGGEYFGLPDVGARVWELLLDGKSLVQAAEAIASEYRVDRATAEEDLIRLVMELRDKGLLVASPTTGPVEIAPLG